MKKYLLPQYFMCFVPYVHGGLSVQKQFKHHHQRCCAGGSGREFLRQVLPRKWAAATSKVVSIITDHNADPHSYEPTSQDARTVANAQYVIAVVDMMPEWSKFTRG